MIGFRVNPRGWWCLALVGILVGPGCGGDDGLPRQAVSGTVTIGGQPLAAGTISFQPEDQGGTGTAVAATVKDGSYAIGRGDGPVPGSYRVSISSPQPDPARPAKPGASPDDGGEPPMREMVSPRYNVKTELKAEVKAGGSNQFDFPLDAAKP